MFLGIERVEWFVLWSGVLGAVVSATVAAFVAVRVLVRSNKHQQKLAAEAVTEQRRLAELQLAEQRTESARVRERAALADIIFAIEWLVIESERSSETLRRHIPTVQAAMARWRIELGPDKMQNEVMKWSAVLVGAAEERQRAAEGNNPAEIEKAENQLSDAVATLTAVALRWPTSDAARRTKLHEILVEKRSALDLPLLPG